MILCATMRSHPDISKRARTEPGVRVMILDGIRDKVKVRVRVRAGVAATLTQLSLLPQEMGMVECTLPPPRQ